MPRQLIRECQSVNNLAYFAIQPLNLDTNFVLFNCPHIFRVCTSDENEKVRRPLLNGSGSPNQNGSVSPQSVTIEEEVKFIDRGSTIKDKHNVIYMVFLLFGIATLLPWNVFITAEDVSPTITILEHLIKTFLLNFVLCVSVILVLR